MPNYAGENIETKKALALAERFAVLMREGGKSSVQLVALLKEIPLELRKKVSQKLLSGFEVPKNHKIFYDHLVGLVGESKAQAMQSEFIVSNNTSNSLDLFLDYLASQGDSNLSQATKEHNMTLAKGIIAKLKEQNAINVTDSEGFTALEYAVSVCNLDLVNLLLESGADPNYRVNINRKSAFQFVLACLKDDILIGSDKNMSNWLEIINCFLNYGANPIAPGILQTVDIIDNLELSNIFENHQDVIDLYKLCNILKDSLNKRHELDKFDYERVINGQLKDGYTPLMIAVVNYDISAIKILFNSKNIDPNLTGQAGNSALHYAANLNKLGFVHYYLSEFDLLHVSARFHQVNESGLTPLSVSMYHENEDDVALFMNTDSAIMAMRLVELIASQSPQDSNECQDMLHSILNDKQYDNVRADIFNFTDPKYHANILIASIVKNNADVFDIIVDNLDQFDNVRFTMSNALIYAIKAQNEYMVERLIASGADVNFIKNGWYPLRYAARHDNGNIAKILIENGAKIDAQDESDFTPLLWAAYYGSESVSSIIVKSKANKNLINRYGETALSIGLRSGYHAVCKEITEGDLSQAGYTKLMIAIWDGDYTAVNEILNNPEHLSDINAVNAGGFSALMVLASKFTATDDIDEIKGLAELAEKLIVLGADVGIVNKSGLNFLQLSGSGKYSMFDDNLQKIFDICCSDEVIKRHNGRNIMHLCMQFDKKLLDMIMSSQMPNYVEYLNKLDYDGNSPLSYLLYDTNNKFNFGSVKHLVDKLGAKFIRNNKEVRTGLQLKVLLSNKDTKNEDIFSGKDSKNINNQDEQGLTALHYACIQGNFDLAKFLIFHGAKINILDNYGRTPVHYAAMKNSVLPLTTAQDIAIEDLNGVTPFVLAGQYGSSDAMFLFEDIINDNNIKNKKNIIKNTVYKHSPFTILFLKYMQDKEENLIGNIKEIENIASLNFKQKLVILSGLRKQCSTLDDGAVYNVLIDVAGKAILDAEFSDFNKYVNFKFTPGWAIGIELEIPELPEYALVPTSDLAAWFPTSTIDDATVKSSVISMHNTPGGVDKDLEFVSHIIQDGEKYNEFLAMCDILTQNGAKVNRTSGFHVHVNCRGTDAIDPAVAPLFDQSDPNWKEKELVYVKFVLLNFISIEQLLRGFMREGVLFDEYGSSYVETISKYREGILACDNLKDLQEKYCSHTKTIDLTALDKHGTIEFRAHEGVVDPILVNAWVECVTRLCAISYEQALSYTDPKSTEPKSLEPKQNIEQLVYLLIAQRNYQKTWDADWGAVESANMRTTSAYPGNNKTPVQVQIQQAPLYQCLGVILQYFDGANSVDSVWKMSDKLVELIKLHKLDEVDNKENANAIFKDILQMINFMRDNPGIIEHKIDLAENRVEQYNEVSEVVLALAIPFGNKSNAVKL